MSQEGRHTFSKEEGELGVKNSRLGRKNWIKFEKQLAKLGLEKATIEKVLEIAKVVIAQPGGLFIIGSLLIDGLQRVGYFGATNPASSPAKTSSGSNQVQSIIGGILNWIENPLASGLSAGSGGLLSNPAQTQSNSLLGSLFAGTSSPSNLTAELLQAEFFAICMTSALGGGQGIATLGTAALAALK